MWYIVGWVAGPKPTQMAKFPGKVEVEKFVSQISRKKIPKSFPDKP